LVQDHDEVNHYSKAPISCLPLGFEDDEAKPLGTYQSVIDRKNTDDNEVHQACPPVDYFEPAFTGYYEPVMTNPPIDSRIGSSFKAMSSNSDTKRRQSYNICGSTSSTSNFVAPSETGDAETGDPDRSRRRYSTGSSANNLSERRDIGREKAAKRRKATSSYEPYQRPYYGKASQAHPKEAAFGTTVVYHLPDIGTKGDTIFGKYGCGLIPELPNWRRIAQLVNYFILTHR